MINTTPQMGYSPHTAQAEYQEIHPFTRQELRRLCTHPHRVVEMVLTRRDRLAANIARRHRLPGLVLGLLLASMMFALPFGAVVGLEKFWQVSIMLCGSMLICFPSLHVFSAFLGSRFTVGQNFSLALLITCVAALFSFAFFPILWFLGLTLSPIDTVFMASLLLAGALFAGVCHLSRVLCKDRLLRRMGPSSVMFLVFWQVLLMFINYRMAIYLELF